MPIALISSRACWSHLGVLFALGFYRLAVVFVNLCGELGFVIYCACTETIPCVAGWDWAGARTEPLLGNRGAISGQQPQHSQHYVSNDLLRHVGGPVFELLLQI